MNENRDKLINQLQLFFRERILPDVRTKMFTICRDVFMKHENNFEFALSKLLEDDSVTIDEHLKRIHNVFDCNNGGKKVAQFVWLVFVSSRFDLKDDWKDLIDKDIDFEGDDPFASAFKPRFNAKIFVKSFGIGLLVGTVFSFMR